MADETQALGPNERSLDDLLAEYIAAEEAGRVVDRSALVARYSQHAAELREFFANRDRMQRLAGPLRDGAGGDGQVGTKVRYFGDYELLEEIAVGGMGIVYKARQVSLNRIVAVKMILKGTLASEDDVKRFRAEAEAAANLQHPGIVAIHEVGLHEGQHYFSMDFVDGQSLAQLPREQPLPAAQAAEFVRDAAEAVHYAHHQGTLHRDLKPSNILIDRQGRVRITDFGLAKRITGNSDLTLTGQILGTPSYMPPEQALSKRSLIGTASDVYSLGAVLYELLAGRPPFRGESPTETLRQVETLDPISPRLLSPTTPRDLETICLKCLEKEPHKRYGTAQLLGEDIGRYLRGEPILARPIGRPARIWRWCRRNPLLATTATAALSLLLAVAAVAGVAYVRESSLRKALQQEQAATKRALTTSQLAVADLQTHSGLVAADQGDASAAALWFAATADEHQEDPQRAQLNLIRAATWSQLAPRPVHAVMHPQEWVMDVKFHASGRYLMTWSPECGPHPGACTVWDLHTEQPVALAPVAGEASCGVWQPGGRILALGTSRGHVLLLPFPGGKAQHDLTFEGQIDFLEWDPTGRYLAVAYGPREAATPADRVMLAGSLVRVWDASEAKFATPELKQPAPVRSLAFHPQGTQLAVVSRNFSCRVFAIGTERVQPLSPPLRMYQYGPSTLVGQRTPRPLFVNEGRRLLTFPDGEARIGEWDTTTWTAVPGRTGAPVISKPEAAVLAPDGKTAVVVGVGGVTILDTDPPALKQYRPTKARQYVFATAISPDGRMFVSGGGDRTAQLWTLPDAKPVGPALIHASSVLATAWSADGQQFATAERGGLVRVWTPPTSALQPAMLQGGGLALLSPSGRWTASRGRTSRDNSTRVTRVYAIADGRPAGPAIAADGLLLDAAFSPDEKELAILTSRTGALSVVNCVTGQTRGGPLAMPSDPRCVKYHPDGKLIAVLCAQGEIVLVDAADLTIRSRFSNQVAYPPNNSYYENGAIDFSPRGDCLITYQCDSAIRVWDLQTTKLRHKIDGHRDRSSGIAFSKDAARMATAARDNTARVWDFASGRPLSEPMVHPDWTYSARFHPQADLLITACRDGQVRIWNWRTTKLHCPPLQHGHEVHAADFTPDGRWAITASEDRTVRAWDVVSGKPMTPAIPLRGGAFSLAISPDGRRVVVGGFQLGLELISLDTLYDADTLPASEFHTLAELMSGRTVETGGGLANIPSAEWYAAWQRYRATAGRFTADLEALAKCDFDLSPVEQSSPAGSTKSPATVGSLPRVVSLDTALASGLRWSAPTRGLKQKYALAYSPAGDRIASRGGEGVQLWSASDGKAHTTFRTDSKLEFYDFAFAPGGQQLAGAATDGIHLFDLEFEEELEILKTDEKTSSSIHRLAFSADGQWLVAGQLHGATIWKTAGWERALTLASGTGWVGGVAFSDDGKLLAAGGQDKQVRVWRVPEWKLLFERAGPSPVYTVAFSPDNGTLAAAFAANAGGQFQFLTASLGERIQAVDVHSKLAHTVVYRSDGRRIATAGDDGTIALWDASTKRPLIRVQADRTSVYCAAFSPDGKSLATVGSEHVLRIWDADYLESLAVERKSDAGTADARPSGDPKSVEIKIN